MRALLTDIELDIQELKCLTDAYLREPNGTLREVLKRNIQQMQGRLDDMLQILKTSPDAMEETPLQKDADVPKDDKSQIEPKIFLEASPVVSETISAVNEPATVILGERIRPVNDLRRSLSLNDSFRFSRELFHNDSELMNRVIEQISEMSSLDAAIAFLLSKVNVSEENEALSDFRELIKKYFN